MRKYFLTITIQITECLLFFSWVLHRCTTYKFSSGVLWKIKILMIKNERFKGVLSTINLKDHYFEGVFFFRVLYRVLHVIIQVCILASVFRSIWDTFRVKNVFWKCVLRFPGAFAQKTLDFAVSFFVLVVIMKKKVFFCANAPGNRSTHFQKSFITREVSHILRKTDAGIHTWNITCSTLYSTIKGKNPQKSGVVG